MTRACLSLLHGYWRAAIHYNPLIVVLAAAAILEVLSVLLRNRWLAIPFPTVSATCGTIGLFAFAVLRNLT